MTGSRRVIATRPGFDGYFAAAKRRVRAMDFRFVKIEVPRAQRSRVRAGAMAMVIEDAMTRCGHGTMRSEDQIGWAMR